MHVIIHDVINCLENVLSSTQYSSYMRIRAPHLLLVIKSSPKEIAQVPFPQRFGLRKEIPGNSTDAILPAPLQLLKTNKAVVFIEVRYRLVIVHINYESDLEMAIKQVNCILPCRCGMM